MNRIPAFFLGCSSPNGFYSKFNDAYDADSGWRTYIITGGPGTGKSTLMKRIASAAAAYGRNLFISPCSADPGSLDAVCLTDDKIIVLDGTAPHIVNAEYPGMCEVTVDLGAHRDNRYLFENREKIMPLCRENAALHQRATRYLGAAAALINDNRRIGLTCTDVMKAAKFGTNLAARSLKKHLKNHGRESVRFLSAVTPDGVTFFSGTLDAMCDKVYVISDELGAASNIILNSVRLTALELGYDTVTCRCPLAPEDKIEHIIIPGMRLGFTTENRLLHYRADTRVIHARRFTDAAALRTYRQRISFNRRAAAELTDAASQALAQAKAVHDKMEEFYIKSMDFDAVNDITEELIYEIL